MSLLISESAAPSTPASGKVALYAKTDGYVYSKDDAGNEYGPLLQNAAYGYTALSGASVDLTSIPSWVTQIWISIVGLSSNGTSIPMIQLGDSGGPENSGYLGCGTTHASASNIFTRSTTGAVFAGNWTAATALQGNIFLQLAYPATNTWSINGNFGWSSSDNGSSMGFTKALSSTLTQLRFTMVNGTDTFDAGSVNARYS